MFTINTKSLFNVYNKYLKIELTFTINTELMFTINQKNI